MRQGYFWPTIRKDVEAFLKNAESASFSPPVAIDNVSSLVIRHLGKDLIRPFPQAKYPMEVHSNNDRLFFQVD